MNDSAIGTVKADKVAVEVFSWKIKARQEARKKCTIHQGGMFECGASGCGKSAV